MWIGIKRILSKRAGKTDKGIVTLRAKDVKRVSSSRGEREVLVEHHRKQGQPKTNRFDMEFEKEVNKWAYANVEESKREDNGSNEVKECVAKFKNRKAAGADEIVNEFLKYGGEGMITMMVELYNNWI